MNEIELPKPIYIMGLDLGQQRDWTAISVAERAFVRTGEMEPLRQPGSRSWGALDRLGERFGVEYRIRHLERPALGTPYTDVVERVVSLIKKLGGEPVLAVDATGVGRPVTDMLWRSMSEELRGTSTTVTPCGVTITGGDSVNRNPDGGGWRVPKRDLVSAALVLLQNGRLKISDSLELKDTLVKELLNFRVKINISTAHDSYEAWREGDHDDLVLSVAMACWAGERFLKKPRLARAHSF